MILNCEKVFHLPERMPQSNYALNATTLVVTDTHALYCKIVISSGEKRRNGGEEEKSKQVDSNKG